MSRSPESDAPIRFSCSRRWPRSSAGLDAAPPPNRKPCVVSMRFTPAFLLHTDGADFLHVGHPHQALLHAVLLEGSHALLEADGEHLGDARVLLDGLLQ